MVGVLLVAPVILVWTGNRRVRFRRHWLEVVGLSAALLDVSGTTASVVLPAA